MDSINLVDYTILGIMASSILLGVLRGFVKEAMSLITWIAALAVAILYYEPFSEYFTNISMVGARILISFVLLALATLIVGGLIGHVISRLINFTGFGVTDRIFGTLFGFARGGIIIALLVMALIPSQFSKNPNWQESRLIPKFEPISEWMKTQIPEDLMQRFQF